MASQEAVYIIQSGNPRKMSYTPDKTRQGFSDSTNLASQNQSKKQILLL
jgi:hypothetical protein